MRYCIVVLALAGVVLSSITLWIHYSGDDHETVAKSSWDSAFVNRSSYAVVGGIPVDITYGLIGSRGRRIRYAASASAFPIASASSSTLSGGSPLRWKFSDDEA